MDSPESATSGCTARKAESRKLHLNFNVMKILYSYIFKLNYSKAEAETEVFAIFLITLCPNVDSSQSEFPPVCGESPGDCTRKQILKWNRSLCLEHLVLSYFSVAVT